MTLKKILQIQSRDSAYQTTHLKTCEIIRYGGTDLCFKRRSKEQCLFIEDKHENKRHGMYEKIADEFNKETISKTTNLVALLLERRI